jgi:hypothetical protein
MKKHLFVLSSAVVVLFAAQACGLVVPTQTGPIPPGAQSSTEPGGLPQSEAGVPRVPVDEAKAAVDRGEAVIVDVRSPGAYEVNHVAGALFIPLGTFETDPASVELNKEQWIITYCT